MFTECLYLKLRRSTSQHYVPFCLHVCDCQRQSAYWLVCVKGIQFLVLADQVVVHLFIRCFEVVNIRLIRGRARQLHVGASPK